MKWIYFNCIIIMLSLTACIQNSVFDKIWVQIEPTQCLSNPWQQDWLKNHDDDYSSYPKAEESSIIKEYYKKQGITIYDIKTERMKDNIFCEACSCPKGEILQLLVEESNLNKMLELGFKKSQ